MKTKKRIVKAEANPTASYTITSFTTGMVCPLLDSGSLGSDRIVGFLPRASERLRRMGTTR